jgi:hypothetical protein
MVFAESASFEAKAARRPGVSEVHADGKGRS